MKNKTKRVFWGFFALDYKVISIYLEEMAEKGWMLEKVGRMTAKFTAIEPRRLTFYVDVFKDEGPLTPANTKGSEEYRSLCQASGWTFITSQDYLQYFYADEGNDPVPIQTDEVLEQKIVETSLFKQELLSTLLFLIVGIATLVLYFPVKHHNLLTFAGVAGTLLFPILFIAVLASTIYSLTRVLKARKNIKRGLPLEKPTLKNARRRIVALHGSGMTIVCIFLVAIFVDAFFDPRILLSFAGPALGLIIGFVLRYIIKKKTTDKKDGVLYVTLTIMFIVFSMVIVNSLFTTRPFPIDDTRVDHIPEGYPVVTMVELREESQRESLIRREFTYGMSPVTPQHYAYWEIRGIDEETKGMRVSYYKTIHPYFAEVIFNGIREDLRKGIKWRGMYFLTKNMITDDEMKASWNMDHLALTEERDEIILQKGNTVIHLSYRGAFAGGDNFDDGKTRDLIVNRLFFDSQL